MYEWALPKSSMFLTFSFSPRSDGHDPTEIIRYVKGKKKVTYIYINIFFIIIKKLILLYNNIYHFVNYFYIIFCDYNIFLV